MTQDPNDPERTTPAGEETAFVGGDTPTTTGPTVGAWPYDESEQATERELPSDLVWHATPLPAAEPPPETRPIGYYLSLVAAVLVVIAVVGAVTVLTLNRPTRAVAGSPAAAGPAIPTPDTTTTSPSSEAPPPSTQPSALDELAEGQLSTLDQAMAPSTCSLPTFRPGDAEQETFYEASEVCADNAWATLLPDLDDIAVITVAGSATETPCGAVAPTDPARQCEGTVYLTPAHLRDSEGNDRYPGRYFGVVLREYAKAVQYRTGLTEDYERAKEDPDASEAELDQRLNAQATCLAGVTAGAMANQGSVDANIVSEIRARLTSVDAPRDAGSWYDKGFQSRTPARCNTWLP
jgi:predicted metalloprotease